MSNIYTEDQLVEQPAIGLFAELVRQRRPDGFGRVIAILPAIHPLSVLEVGPG